MVRPASFFRKLRERKINNDALLRLRQSRIKLPITRFIRNRSAKTFVRKGACELQFLRRLLGFTILGLCFSANTSGSEARPNFLVILTDDQGWSSLGCYGGQIVETPNLDKLASAGARFTSAYTTSQCTPTRASLLTGQYTARNRMWHVIGWYGCPWGRMTEPPFVEQLPRTKPTIASELKKAGYATAIMGKWHLTGNEDGGYRGLKPEQSKHFGFDFAAPLLGDEEFEAGGDRGVKTLTNQALDFITKNRDQPWFCFLSHHMIHGKVVAPPDVEQQFQQLGYSNQGPNRAVYLAGLKVIDDSVGKLMAGLQDLDIEDNTVVIFLSDNGGIFERLEHRNLPKPNPRKPTLKINLIEYDNSPLRNGKGSIYEGGVRVPMIVRWPKGISPGLTVDVPVHAIDLAPSIFEWAGHETDSDVVLDGTSLSAVVHGNYERLLQRPIFQYCPFYDLNWGQTPCASVRQGRYKLIEFFGDRFNSQHEYETGRKVELYDLNEDISEADDLADELPATTARLQDLLQSWMDSMKVPRSQLNPYFDSARAFETTNRKPDWLK